MAPAGIDVAAFQRARNLTDAELAAVRKATTGLRFIGLQPAERAFSAAHWQRLHDTIVATLKAWHSRHPDQVGPADVQLLREAGYRFPDAVAHAVTAPLEEARTIVRERLGLRLPTHQPGLQGDDAALWQRVAATIEADGLRPGSLADIAGKLDVQQRRLQSLLTSAGRHGLAHRISNTRYLTGDQLARLRAMAEDIAAATPDHTLDVRAFRDATAIGRNMAIEVLEYFDKIGFTSRRGDHREIKRQSGDK